MRQPEWSTAFECRSETGIAKEQVISIKRNRNTHKYYLGPMHLVQWIDGRLKQSQPGNAQRNGGGMSISGRSKTWKKWSAANILKEELSQQSHEWTFATQKARWRQETERYRQRRESKGDQWQSDGIDMIPANQIASCVDGGPKTDA